MSRINSAAETMTTHQHAAKVHRVLSALQVGVAIDPSSVGASCAARVPQGKPTIDPAARPAHALRMRKIVHAAAHVQPAANVKTRAATAIDRAAHVPKTMIAAHVHAAHVAAMKPQVIVHAVRKHAAHLMMNSAPSVQVEIDRAAPVLMRVMIVHVIRVQAVTMKPQVNARAVRKHAVRQVMTSARRVQAATDRAAPVLRMMTAVNARAVRAQRASRREVQKIARSAHARIAQPAAVKASRVARVRMTMIVVNVQAAPLKAGVSRAHRALKNHVRDNHYEQ